MPMTLFYFRSVREVQFPSAGNWVRLDKNVANLDHVIPIGEAMTFLTFKTLTSIIYWPGPMSCRRTISLWSALTFFVDVQFLFCLVLFRHFCIAFGWRKPATVTGCRRLGAEIVSLLLYVQLEDQPVPLVPMCPYFGGYFIQIIQQTDGERKSVIKKNKTKEGFLFVTFVLCLRLLVISSTVTTGNTLMLLSAHLSIWYIDCCCLWASASVQLFEFSSTRVIWAESFAKNVLILSI